MARRKRRLTLLLFAGAAVALVWRRRRARPREQVDLYYEDGSKVSFPEGTEEAGRLLPLARRVLSAARG